MGMAADRKAVDALSRLCLEGSGQMSRIHRGNEEEYPDSLIGSVF